MANEEHIELASFLKNVHSELRKASLLEGPEMAWLNHCNNKKVLATYSQHMKKLANHWDINSEKDDSIAISRIKWSAEFCYDYFINKVYMKYAEKDQEIATKINVPLEEEKFEKPIKLIDVGSCYNPFKEFEYLNVFAIDLCPANDIVFQCDFLNVPITSQTLVTNNIVNQLEESSFDAVTFCFLLGYIPDSNLRIKACEKAYDILKPGGLLIINTPDSKHVGSNAKILKNWRYTLSTIGFNRIKYEKFKHMHCMTFRKSLNKEIAIRWGTLHKEPYMKLAINIPQDFHNTAKDVKQCDTKTEASVDSFEELPFFRCNKNI